MSLRAADEIKSESARKVTLSIDRKVFGVFFLVNAVVLHERLVSRRVVDGKVQV